MIAATLVLVTLALAFANGANDVSKGIATLVGSGVSNDRRAVMWGSLCTFTGAVAAGFPTQAIVSTYVARQPRRRRSSGISSSGGL